MQLRNHEPLAIESFNGLWKRGDADSTPKDHFINCNNIDFVQSGFRWRSGINPYSAVPNVVRFYVFTQETGQSLLVLDANGDIYDTAFLPSPILTISGMTDFAFVSIAGRAYISPHDGRTGLENEFLYVYEGDGTPARKAAGTKPTTAEGALAAVNSATTGNVEEGIHIFAVVYETESGFLTAPGPGVFPTVTADGTKKVDLSAIPVAASSTVVKRHILATKTIYPPLYTGNTEGYEFFFIPDGEIADNTTTILTVNFYDADLLDSADDLFDLYDEIPAVACLNAYHGRLVGGATFDDISEILISNVGEPEAINQVDGLLIFPLDGNPVTNLQEFRDVLYGFKQSRTNAWSDNGDVPSSWPMTILDQGVGASIHGIATVLDSGGVNVDFLITIDYSGVMLFNGTFIRPELSWKIHDYWLSLDRDFFTRIQAVNDSVSQLIYITLPDRKMLFADYQNGLTPKDIRWSPWEFTNAITSIGLINTNTLLLASNGAL
jgi:hypothetical protein